MKKLLPFLALLLTLPCTLFFCAAGRADFGLGTRVPLPTAAGQIPVSVASGLSFTYQPVTFSPDGVHWTFGGGALGTGSVLTANVANTGDNGLTVVMPNGGTGYAFQVKSSTGAQQTWMTTNGEFHTNQALYVANDLRVGYRIINQNITTPNQIWAIDTNANSGSQYTGAIDFGQVNGPAYNGIGFAPVSYTALPDTFLLRTAPGVLSTNTFAQTAIRTVTAATDSAAALDNTIEFNASAACTETLPAASAWKGQRITLIDLSANSVAVSNTVLGSPADTLSGIGASETFFSDGQNVVLVH